MRIHDELVLMLKEEDPARAIMRMHELDELRFIHPRIKIKKDLTQLFKSIDFLCRWYKKSLLKKRILDSWLMYLIALFENLGKRSVRNICDKFVFRRGDKMRILSYKEHGEKIIKFLSQGRTVPPSGIYKKLHPLSYEVILLIMAKVKDNKIREQIINFLLRYDKIRIKTTGDDLERIGFKPGPKLGRALDKILYAKIDGKIKTKKDELALARKIGGR